MQKPKKVALAYSGGLDTSIISPWLKEHYDCKVVAVCGDIGQGGEELSGLDAKAAPRLSENRDLAFLGVMKAGNFDLDASSARSMLAAVGNPNGRPNSDGVKRRLGGTDVVRRSRDTWIIDFNDMSEQYAQIEKLGGMGGIMSMLPGMAKMKDQLAVANLDEIQIKRQRAIIGSMIRSPAAVV